jgi:hypothetical protein
MTLLFLLHYILSWFIPLNITRHLVCNLPPSPVNKLVVSHHRAPTKIKLPNYDGTYYADIFIAQVQKIVVLNCWEEDELIGHLFSVLNGPARDILFFIFR